MVGEINKIYAAYREKSPEDTTYAAMEGLVKDFNSRYGIMKKEEAKKYMEKYRSQEDYNAIGDAGRDEDFNDFDLLDSKNARSSGSAPSDRYLAANLTTQASGVGWTSESMELIKKLHYNIAQKFKQNYRDVMQDSKVEDLVNVTSTIHGVVEQYKYELAAAGSNDEKVKIVAKAIQSVGMYSNQNPSKFMMFHEMVVSPLHSLFRLFQVLRQFIGSYAALDQRVEMKVPGGAAAGTPPRPDGTLKAGIAAPDNVNEDVERMVLAAIASRAGAADVNATNLLRFQLSLLTTVKTALGDLVSISLGGSAGERYPVVDLGAVKDYAGLVLENVKKALSSLRSYMPTTYIDLFENIANRGSVFWMQAHMMDLMFGNNDSEPNETKLNVKNLNKNIKNMFTAAVRYAAATPGTTFESAFDLCYWRTSRNDLVAADVRPIGNKALPFPGNVIELVDDLDPVKGTLEKQQMEKKYNALFTGYGKAVVGLVERKTANDEAKAGVIGMFTNTASQQTPGDLDVLAGIKLDDLQSTTPFADKNYMQLKRTLTTIKNEAVKINDTRNAAGDVKLFTGLTDPDNIDLDDFDLTGVGEMEAEGKTFAEVAVLEKGNPIDNAYMNNWDDTAVTANPAEIAAQAFIRDHRDIKRSYNTAYAIINAVPNQETKLQVSKVDQDYVYAASIAMAEYQKIVSGAETDLTGIGSTTTLIFNTAVMNKDGSFENPAGGSFTALGIVPMFNRTLQRYMDTFFDRLNSKFYSPLIEEFATGHFSPAITGKKAYSDTNIIGTANRQSMGVPKPGVVVASSNARGIRIVLNKRDDKGVAKLYALNSLADVSPQMKETMRANLPLFRSAFRDLYDQAEVLKKLMFNTNIKGQMEFANGIANRDTPAPNRDQSAEDYYDTRAASPINQNYFKQALEQVQLGCEVLVKCANQVYKELNDAPLFGETYNGSLAEFKQKAKVYPTTPLSIAQHYEQEKLMPGHANGSDQFKLVYALRGLADFQIAKAPGYEEILRMYNVSVPEGAKMSPKYFEEYTKAHLPLLQSLIRLTGPVYTFNDSPHFLGGLFGGGVTVDMANMRPPSGNGNADLRPFTISTRNGRIRRTSSEVRDDILSLMTNTDVEYERQRFVDIYANALAPLAHNDNTRPNIQYRNLIETGIVPVNVNALQREVPLVNLLNYAYTFEKSVIDALGVNLHNAGDDIVDPVYPAGADEDAKRMAYSLVHPYGSIPAAAFDGDYKRMLMGDGPNVGKLRFARPKFISDQIWNKLCVRSMLKAEGDRRPAVGALAFVAADPSNVHYVKPDGSEDVVRIPNLDAKKVMGKRRFDTVLVRNLVWTVQLHRFLTWNIKEKTRKVLNPVSQGEDAYSPDAVELYGSEGVESYPL
jgi:hypothetical protein